MAKPQVYGSWRKPLAVAALLVGAAVFTGCYAPYYYGHPPYARGHHSRGYGHPHGGEGGYAYGDGERSFHHDRRHHRRHCHRHPDRCWH